MKKANVRKMLRIRKIDEIQAKGLGQKIREARYALRGKKTLEEICNFVGVSETYWYDIEKERIKGCLSYDNLRKIEEVLNIDLEINFNQPVSA
ncbi:MAG: helix-turn-helix transcriptional regulator [Pleurocapsa sp. MO_226.B13]|nr:helix-turn-helix transcriptional regulator [Pleurocapsa sp. MO_226.B13]